MQMRDHMTNSEHAQSSQLVVLRSLRPVDVLIAVFLVILTILVFSFSRTIPYWEFLSGINCLAGAVIIVIAYFSATTRSRILRWIHDWYPVPSIFLLFKEVHVIIQLSARLDWDPLLINGDRAIFGTDPTVWLASYSTPILTEVLQIAYVSYYFIMLTVGIELYLQREQNKFSFTFFTIVLGFFLSYLGYLAFPAVGPRFTLHHFEQLNSDLPGVWCTESLRNFINAGESIPSDAVHAVLLAQRDAFPSGHTEMTLLSMYLAYRYTLRSRFLLTVLGILLIISTVYLRYHYVVDVLGGIVFMLLTVFAAPRLFRWWEQWRNNGQ